MDIIGRYIVQPDQPSEMKNFIFLDSELPLTVLTVVYMIFVLKLGPWLMRDRKPMQLKNVILAYNVIQMLMNLFMFLVGLTMIYRPQYYSFMCIGKLPITDTFFTMTKYSHFLYFVNKVMDYMDTIFFVLRKSDKQITFLHVYHHIVMAYTAYWILHYYGMGGQHAFIGTLNAFVHVLMYSYYAASALKSSIKQTHWKRNITNIQMIQFFIAFVHFVAMPADCQYPPVLRYLNIVQVCIMIALFSNFYVKTYLRKKQLQTSTTTPQQHNKNIKSS